MVTRQFWWIFLWHTFRYARRHKLLAALNVASVGLGVAVFFAIQLANNSARLSFDQTVDLVSGKAEAEVRSTGQGLDEMLYPEIANHPAVKNATPLVEGYVTLPDYPGEYLRLLGLDPFTNTPFVNFELQRAAALALGEDVGDEETTFNLERWLRMPGGVGLTREQANRLGLEAGESFRVLVNGEIRELRLEFVLNPTGNFSAADSRVAAMDIGWAQELLNSRGQLSSVQLILKDPERLPAVLDEMQADLPPDLLVTTPEQRSERVQRLLSGFRLNLSALSLISLVIGMFLIYNTISASVIRRRRETGILRSMGAGRGEVRALFLGEALVSGAPGIVLGLLGGWVLAGFLITLVARTSASLYNVFTSETVILQPGQLVIAIIAGLASILIAAWFPAEQAAREEPVENLSFSHATKSSHLRTLHWLLGGAVVLGVGALCGWLAVVTGPNWLGFGAALLVLLGFSMAAPFLGAICGRLLGRAGTVLGQAIPAAGLPLRLGSANYLRSLGRNSVTTAALASAIAMMIGVGVMIHSFRLTVDDWVKETLRADVYIAPAGNEIVGLKSFMPAQTLDWLAARDEVASIDTFREYSVTIEGEPVPMAVVESETRTLTFLEGDAGRKMALFQQPDHVLVTEPFFRRFGLGAGDLLTLPTPDGPREFTIAGVYRDYTRDQGLISIWRDNFLELWDDPRVNSLGIVLAPEATEDTAQKLAEAFREEFAEQGQFAIYTNRALRTRIFEIFDQTFAITSVLRMIAVLVAIAGIILSLATLVYERMREIGVLRSMGAGRGQVQGFFLGEAAVVGVAATVCGIASGLVLAFVLTDVINRAFFGWSIALAIPWPMLAWTPVWVLPVSILAGLVPAHQAARIPPAEAVRFE